MAVQPKDPKDLLVQRTVRRVEEWMPTTTMPELELVISQLPREHQALVHEGIRHGWGIVEKAAAAALGSIIMEQEMQPNSAVTLWPINPATGAPFVGGAAIPRNTVVPLQPVTDGATEGPYQFVRGQRWFGALTITADTAAGWCIVAGTMKLATDPISGLQYGDTTFGIFEQDVVQGRMVTGEYERHKIIEEIEFTCSAILRNEADQPMLGGLTIQFYDERCKKEWDDSHYEVWTDDYTTLVRDVIRVFHGGMLSRRLETLRLAR
jgi:hypothetical protein